MIRMLPWFAEWMAHLSRMSGKSVTAKASRTPQDWFIGSPRSSRPIAARVPLREPSQPMTYFARMVEGGFRWSSQHPEGGGCDGHSEAAVGPGTAGRVGAVTRPARGGTARGPAAVLGLDRGGSAERGRGDRRGRVAGGGDPLVPGGGRHATIDAG